MKRKTARKMLEEREGYLLHSCFGDCCITPKEKKVLIAALKRYAR